ncbi:hypothetical protein [Amycolatopsis sp. YIM 10]|uniref:hypothetical protein n=1 Tax=Amycolatopsis sp. YIM 10 TaxID=2653857 RepID=UPI00129047C4|nr:hypothetical protein [Amycolatopsis sp. YIM 10]QFU88369.1 hypothetical protein YIM_15940 [Amycolatopsis sp. YIM 10]
MSANSVGSRSSGGLARRIVTIAWLVISVVQVVIWLLMSVLGTSVKGPFWLWTIGIGGAALLVWRSLDPARRGGAE